MQFDLFHVYTVDVHTLFVLRNLRRFTVPKYRDELPFAHDLMETLPKPELIYLAALFHDIAKGRGGDHSQLGAEDARAFCQYLGLSTWDSELVAWLVRHHLTMSTTAQRQDISDPEVVNRFAVLMGDRVHLNYLYLVTVADIRGTNPTLWNSWKDALLKELYHATLRALRRGLENPVGSDELVLETRDEAWQGLADRGLERREVDAFWNTLGDDYFLRHSPDEIAWQTRAVFEAGDPDRPLVLIRRRTHRGGTEVFVSARDREHLFARVTTAMDQLGLTIADARIITSSANRALDTLIVLEENGRAIEGEQRLEEIRAALEATLEQREAPPEPVTRRVQRTLKHFPVPTQITFRDDSANGRTSLEVTASDRPGLLSRIALAMTECGVQLLGAKVATFGERAEDIFLVTDGHWRPLGEDLKRRLTDAIHEQLD
jgi:[protein-PII] uridylyltransferase